MSAPKFILVQGVDSWVSGSVTEFSTTSGSGDVLNNLVGAISYSSDVGPTGPQTTNGWSATYPVYMGTNSYEFIFGLYVISPSDNTIENMRVWVPNFTAITGCNFFIGTINATGFATPVTSDSTVATLNFTEVNDQSTAYIGPNSPSNSIGSLSDPVYTQVAVGPTAVGGNQTGMPSIAVSIDLS